MLQNGLPYIFLRPSFFMQNLSTTHRREIRERDEIFVPAGNGKTHFVDVRDIGEVAALVLQGETHLNKAYELTGSRAYSYAEILSRLLHREIRYRKPSVLSFFFFWRTWREGIPAGFVVVMIALYSMARFSKAAGTHRRWSSCWAALQVCPIRVGAQGGLGKLGVRNLPHNR